MTIQHFLPTFYSVALLGALTVPVPIAAQAPQQGKKTDHFPRYVVEDLGTLGGPYSFAYSLNNAGVVSGGAATATQNGDPSQAVVNAPQTAFFWDRGKLLGVGTLGGPNSAGSAFNEAHEGVIDSETATLSRQGEDVCAFGTNLQCLAATWQNGKLNALPLLPGGNNTYALDINDRGQVVGFGDTDVYDLNCSNARTMGFRFQAVIWEPNRKPRQLSPLDPENGVAFAFGINNRGQVVGASGACGDITPPPYVTPSHAILWAPDGTPTDLGSPGGPAIAVAINEHGDVSGTFFNADSLPQPFLWTPESGKPVALNPPDGFTAAVNVCCKTINQRREIVGFMLDSDFNSHAFLWKNGVMIDLNDLLPKNSPWMLQGVAGLNESGQITGQGLINGEVHAFLATPCYDLTGGAGDGHCGNNSH